MDLGGCICKLVWAMTEPTDCQCECHEPNHEARKPHPATMIGRR